MNIGFICKSVILPNPTHCLAHPLAAAGSTFPFLYRSVAARAIALVGKKVGLLHLFYVATQA